MDPVKLPGSLHESLVMNVPICCSSIPLLFGYTLPSLLLCLSWFAIVDQMTWDGLGVCLGPDS